MGIPASSYASPNTRSYDEQVLSKEVEQLVDRWVKEHSLALRALLMASQTTRSSAEASRPHLVREVTSLLSRTLDDVNSAVIRGLLVRAGLSDRTDLERRLVRAARDPEWLRWLCSLGTPEDLARELQKSR